MINRSGIEHANAYLEYALAEMVSVYLNRAFNLLPPAQNVSVFLRPGDKSKRALYGIRREFSQAECGYKNVAFSTFLPRLPCVVLTSALQEMQKSQPDTQLGEFAGRPRDTFGLHRPGVIAFLRFRKCARKENTE